MTPPVTYFRTYLLLLLLLAHATVLCAILTHSFRRVAAELRGKYKPGEVPDWLEQQAKGGAAAATHSPATSGGSHRRGGGVGGVGDAMAAEEHELAGRVDEHRWLFSAVVAMWAALLA